MDLAELHSELQEVELLDLDVYLFDQVGLQRLPWHW